MALTYDEAIQFITSTPSAKKVLFSGGEGMERAKHFFKLLGNPQETFRSMHIAGTSGKGTVAYMIESLLRYSGRSTGLTLSPHVYDIRERCIVNGELLPKEKFASAVEELIEPSLGMDHTPDGRPTYFETTNAIAFKQFAKEKVDYGIIETGLGGQYDSTNTISRTDKLAVITKLGLDHVEILGNTIDKIARQKAGIMPFGGDAIIWRPEEIEARETIESVAEERGTKLLFVDKSLFTIDDNNPNGMAITYHDGIRTIESIMLPPGGEHQAENATLAIKSVLFLAGRDGFIIEDSMIRDGMKAVSLPGRLEHRRLFDRDVIFDGAHNPQKIAALLQSLEPRAKKPIFVLALKKTKDADEILRLIAPRATSVITSQFFTDQDGSMTNLSFTAIELASMAEDCGIEATACEDSLQAVRAACKQADQGQQVVVTGSFYFLGELSVKLPSTLEF
jgi:dihydrofolate synthase/folylpolyglutamate synthase